MRDRLTTQRAFCGFLMVSGICWLLHNAIVIVTDKGGAPLALSIAISFAVTVPAGYAMHSLISFRRSFEVAAFVRYALAMSINLPLAFAALWFWRDFAGLRIEIAAPLASASSTIVNFALCRFAVFGRRETAVTSSVAP